MAVHGRRQSESLNGREWTEDPLKFATTATTERQSAPRLVRLRQQLLRGLRLRCRAVLRAALHQYVGG